VGVLVEHGTRGLDHQLLNKVHIIIVVILELEGRKVQEEYLLQRHGHKAVVADGSVADSIIDLVGVG
jgi:hypothetical protein